ncbi:hypothetical protein RE2895_60960 (plasmid) [Rhodococcus erythropolis]|nr:hypothetical protein RE2895_60960 [Rhodococcus erythropolis]
MLKGGASLLVRLPDARYSQDIDLLHTAAGLEEAIEDLRAAADLSELDPLSFVIRDEPVAMTGGVDGAKLKVEVYYDALYLFSFPIDLSTELVAVGDVDYQSPRPIVAMEGLAAMPEFALYPLPAQIADKVCNVWAVRAGWRSVDAVSRFGGSGTDHFCMAFRGGCVGAWSISGV